MLPGIFGPGAGISLRRELSGDFDIQVDFTNFSGPSVDFVQAFFNVYQDSGATSYTLSEFAASQTDGIQTAAKVGGGGLINWRCQLQSSNSRHVPHHAKRECNNSFF